jgi:hypothetical protein
MSLLVKETQLNRGSALFAALGSGGGSVSTITSPNLITSTITNQFLTTSGTLSLTAQSAVNTTQQLAWKAGGNTVYLGSQLDNQANQRPTVAESTGNLARLMTSGLWASQNAQAGAEAVYSHNGGFPYIYTQQNASNVDVLKVNNDYTTALYNISSINNVVYPPPGSGTNFQQASTGGGPSAAGVSLTPAVWTPLISTTSLFNFTAGKSYECCIPVGVNNTGKVGDQTNLYLGASIQGGSNAIANTSFIPPDTSVVNFTNLRWTATAPSTGALPLVFSLNPQNTVSTLVVSANVPVSVNNLITVEQKN